MIFPYILVAPAYFADKIQLGGLMQTASAFGSVQKALSFFVSIYRTLAEWRAVVARLDGFETAIESAATLTVGAGSIDVVSSTGSDEIDLEQLLVRLPNGTPLVSADGFSIQRQSSARWSPARPAPASRPCSAPSPASGRSAAARSRSPQRPR